MITPEFEAAAHAFLDALTPEKRHEIVQQVITDEQLNALLDEEFENLKKSYREDPAHEERMMILFVLKDDKIHVGDVACIADGWPQDGTKAQVQMGLGVTIAERTPKRDLRAVGFYSESWKIKLKPGEERPEGHFENDPRARESINLVFRTLDGRMALALADISRKTGEFEEVIHKPYKFGDTDPVEMPALQRILAGFAMVRRKEAME
jgi:hypothetical protein